MARLLIINADDLGYDPQVTKGILEAMDQGVVTSATLMVNGPHSESAAQAGKGRALGLHLNLSRWSPAGSSFPERWLREGLFDEAHAPSLPAEVVEEECLAQWARFEALVGAPATHLDVHRHLHRHPRILEGVGAAARRLKAPVRSIDPSMRAQLTAWNIRTSQAFLGDAGAQPFWTLERLRVELQSAPLSGLCELMCHPGHTPSTVVSGYGAQRETELQTFLDPRAREELVRQGFTLVSWK